MNFKELLDIVGDEPLFETGILLAGNVDAFDVRKQLSRWTEAGKIIQLRRGLYSLANPYRKTRPHPFLIANRLQPNSYLSLQSALGFYGMIPESAITTTSVTTSRPRVVQTLFGTMDFRHVQAGWFHGYQQIDLGNGQKVFMATPEKALLDLIYLQPGGEKEAYLRELRLQSLEKINLEKMQKMIQTTNSPKLFRAFETIHRLGLEESSGYEDL